VSCRQDQPSRLGLGKALVISQVALSIVLLIGAGLLAASFWKLTTVDTGFDRNNVLINFSPWAVERRACEIK
jgi:hypothetical protein